MNEYSMHNAMQNSRTRKEKTDNKSSIDEIAFLAFHINKAESFILMRERTSKSTRFQKV